jgi:hypothetical protein
MTSYEIFGPLANNQEHVLELWPKAFKQYLKLLGFNKAARKEMFHWMEHGLNWEKLHETEDDKAMSLKDLRKHFYNDIFYCSDRMCMDRLMRIHWLYWRIIERIKTIEERIAQ